MTMTAPLRCSALAEDLEEPMVGTVEQRVRWLLVEDHSAWGSDAAGDVLGVDLSAAVKRARIRALLIRRREGDPAADAVRRTFLVDTDAGHAAIRDIHSVDELTALPLETMPVEAFGTSVRDAFFLVCSNGKRDACCAVRGRALLAAMGPEHGGRTWECTHLGGHRFAANLVCLPHGIVYGRVAPADGPRLANDYLDGRVDPAALRGRSAWPQAAQVAEQHVRASEGRHGLAEVGFISASVEGDRAEVTLAVAGGLRELVLRSELMTPPRATSCRADDLGEPVHWRVEA